jgi:hypothetical protein
MSRRSLLLVSLTALGCGTEAPAPDKPTWVDDVQPILQANCLHCHGATADIKATAKRWDVPELATKAPYAEMGFMEAEAFVSANNNLHFALVSGFISAEVDDAGRMPPPPATRLSARDIKVLENWRDNNFAIGSHRPNAKPTVRWLDKGKGLYEVSDGNGDQVLGQLDCDGMIAQIPRTGGHKLPTDFKAPCQVRLFDGFDDGDVTVTLK